MEVWGEYFYGNKISDYGIANGYVDYRTLAEAFDAVLNNDIMFKTAEIGYWEQESGFVDNSDEIDEIKEEISELEDALSEAEDNEDEAEIERLTREISEKEEAVEELEREQEELPEIYQYFIVSDNGAEILERANEIVYYNEELDMYVWGVTHWGTSWDYVLTDIKCNTGNI